MYGAFWSCASRIFACIRSARTSTSTRRSACRSESATVFAYSMWRSAIGITTACTGASHSGNAPP